MRSGRANYKCTLPHLQIPVLEQAIANHYKTIRPADGLIDTFRAEVARAVNDSQQTVRDLRTAAAKRLRNIDLQDERPIDALAVGDLPPAPIHRKIRALQLEKARLKSNKTDADKRLTIGAHALDMALQLVSVPETTYEQAPDNVRREINGAFFERVWIDEHGDVVESELVPPIRFIVDTYQDRGNTKRPDRAVEASALRPDTDGGPLPFLRDLFEVRGSNKDAVVKARATYSNRTTGQARGSNTTSFVELAEIYSKQAHLTSTWAKILAYEPSAEPRRVSHARPRNLSRRISAGRRRAIVKGYEAGLNSRQLATQFGISAPSILRLLHQDGVRVRGH